MKNFAKSPLLAVLGMLLIVTAISAARVPSLFTESTRATASRLSVSNPTAKPSPSTSPNNKTSATGQEASATGQDSTPGQTVSKPGPLAPNKNGQIMILMYHNFQPKEGDWNRTPLKFREDLKRLYDKGYRLVNLRAVLDNRIALPKGYTPVVLTFDDGWQAQFNYLVNGDKPEVDPDSAVGILREFAKEHPEMGLAGTFYLNADPFGQPRYWQEKVRQLIAWGFEIGNHTLTHANLRQAAGATAVKEMAQLAALLKEAAPDYELDSLALPFGAMPHDRAILAGGTYQGKSYRNRAVLLVGANPAPAPGTSAFDPMNLPRIQANDSELSKWLDYFDRHPEQRYVSDGSAPAR